MQYYNYWGYAAAIAGTALLAVCLYFAVRRGVQYYKSPKPELEAAAQESSVRVFLRSALLVLALKAVLVIITGILTGEFFGEGALIWNRWDAPHYLDIAKDGYVSTGENNVFIAFFPLYPALLSLASVLTGEYFTTGSVLSMLFFAFALFYLYKLAEREYGQKTAKRVQLLLLLYPMSYYCTIPYTEGLFLALTAAFLYYLRGEKFIVAGVLGLFCALTRSVGVMLVFPYAAAVVRKILPVKSAGEFIKKLFGRGWPIFFIPAGTLIYLLINYIVFSDPLYFLTAQREHWSQGMCFIGRTLKTLMECAINRSAEAPELFIPELVAIFGVLVLLIRYVRRKNTTIYAAYALPMFYMSVSVTWLLSAPRYMLPIYPIYFELAESFRSRRSFVMLCAVMAALSLLACIVFALGGDIY